LQISPDKQLSAGRFRRSSSLSRDLKTRHHGMRIDLDSRAKRPVVSRDSVVMIQEVKDGRGKLQTIDSKGAIELEIEVEYEIHFGMSLRNERGGLPPRCKTYGGSFVCKSG